MLRRPLLWLALLCHLLFAGGYAFATPAFEGPDENAHFQYAWHLANGGGLPVTPQLAATQGRGPLDQTVVLAHHPPLYYALLAAVLVARGEADTVEAFRTNPTFGQPGQPGRYLRFQHGDDERAPLGAGMRLLIALRLVGVGLGLLTLLCVHALGRVACPDQPRVADVATLLAACLPMWSFASGVLNSDALANLLAAATLLRLACCARERGFGWGAAAQLGLLLGLALLTKVTTLFLVPVAAVTVMFAAPRGERLAALGRGLFATALALAVAGWWLVRNLQLYGDPLALAAHDAAFPPIPAEAVSGWFWGGFLPQIATSLLGTFGWFALPPHPVLVWIGGAAALAALLGLALPAATPRPRPLWLLLLACGLVFAATAHFNLKAPQPQGRLLFPALAPGAVLAAAGLLRAGAVLRLPPLRLAWLAVPPLAATLVAWLWFAPAFRAGLAPADAHFASLTGGIVADPDDHTPRPVVWRTPLPEGPCSEPPRLPFAPPRDTPPDAVWSLYAYDADGRIWLASHEWGASVTGSEALLPAAAWQFLPTDRDVFVVLRRVPDYAHGERLEAMPRSKPLRLRRR